MVIQNEQIHFAWYIKFPIHYIYYLLVHILVCERHVISEFCDTQRACLHEVKLTKSAILYFP